MPYNFDELIDRRIPGDIKYSPVNGREDILPLWVADMDFRAPECVSRALTEHAERGIFGYQTTDEEYDELVCAWEKERFGFAVEPSRLLKTPGVMFAAAAAIRALSGEEDGVLIFEPVYPPFANVVKNNHRELIVSELKREGDRYEIDFADVEEKLSSGAVRLVLFCSPHNPVGRVWTREELLTLTELCLRFNVRIISDEIHADFVYSGHRHIPIASLSQEASEISVTCTAPTKSFNLASLQASNIIIPNDQMRRAVQHEIYASGYSLINSMAIAACKAVYRDGREWLLSLLSYLEDNRALLKEAFPSDGKIRLIPSEGTYLAWLDFSSLGWTDKKLNETLLYTAGVRLNPGVSFGKGGSHFMRLNYACPKETLTEAIERIKTLER